MYPRLRISSTRLWHSISKRAISGGADETGFVLVDIPPTAAEKKEAARARVMHHAAKQEVKMQKKLDETGFVLVNEPEPEPEPEDPVPDSKQYAHYEDKKLVNRLRGTPGFKEEEIKAMLPYVRKDPSLIDDLQDMDTASHFQSIARGMFE